MNETINLGEKDVIVMKLLHYFITEKNYNPIILQGAENEIWLENMDSEYKIVRIVSNHIHNDEQFEFDLFKTKHVIRKIKRKTLSLNMNVLSIFTDVRDEVNLDSSKNYECIYINDENDIDKYTFIKETFPDMSKKLKFSEEGVALFVKITSDINKKNKKDQIEAEDIFKMKKPIVTSTLIGINILLYVLMILSNNYLSILDRFALYGPYVIERYQFYRLITSAFLHVNIFHLAFNCYALYAIGNQMESFLGKTKYLIVYLFSAAVGGLLSIVLNYNSVSIGASGAIFGLLGSMLYFGYHYRVFLGTVIKSQIIPLILINLAIGFIFSDSINNFAHIGGLIGGALITMALGVKYKSTNSEKTNGWVMSIIFVAFLLILAFKVVK